MSFLAQVKSLSDVNSFFEKSKQIVLGRSDPMVYVGTYGKYSAGSIEGKWLKLTDYSSYEDFLEAARKLHSDENDPEFMFQDYEGFPERFYSESSLAPELWDWLDLSEEDQELLEMYIDGVTEDPKSTIEQARDAYMGSARSEEDWAEQFLEDTGGLPEDQLSAYLMISSGDAEVVADDIISSRLDDLRSDMEMGRYEDVFDVISINKEKYEELQEKLDNESDEDKQEELKIEIEKLASKSLVEWEAQEVEDLAERIEKDPVGYFVDEEGTYSVEDLAKAKFMQIDYEAYARDARLNRDVYFVQKNDEVHVFSGR